MDLVLGKNGSMANRMFQYMFCRELQRGLDGASLSGYNIPAFNLSSPYPEMSGRILKIDGGHRHDLKTLRYLLQHRVYDGLIFDGYAQRLEYYRNRDLCSSYFVSSVCLDDEFIGPDYITINIRAKEVLRDTHRDYNPVPISFYEYIVKVTGLKPVLVGQLDDSFYAKEIVKRLPKAKVICSNDPAMDFEFIRRSHNIVVCVSTFSWLAAWLSKSAKRVHMPLLGFLNPDQRPDINLVPLNDDRYTFYDFPMYHWHARPDQCEALLRVDEAFATVSPDDLRGRICF